MGGGLAGSEAAFQAAERGVEVVLYEMRPGTMTGAHTTGFLAELVCSNSLGSRLPDRATGLLMHELDLLDSLLVKIALEVSVPAGGALAVDREGFSQRVTEAIERHPCIQIKREEVTTIPEGPCILATGPLTSDALAANIAARTGEDNLYFYDALAPIVTSDSIDMSIAFRASRYDKGDLEEGDYINCPLNEEQYNSFVNALLTAERIPLRPFEQDIENGTMKAGKGFFEGCLPIEVLASRGIRSLAYGPMRPVGLDDPRTGRWPHAVLQLRQDDAAGSLYNLVGFQTNLTFPEQRRVFRMIPGLEQAEFVRFGQMHRNTFLNAPGLLDKTLVWRDTPVLFVAGQLSGVEGYMGNIGTGWVAGVNAAAMIQGKDPVIMPSETMLGSLLRYITESGEMTFQPMKANFGLMVPFEDGVKRNKKVRAQAYAQRSLRMLESSTYQCA